MKNKNITFTAVIDVETAFIVAWDRQGCVVKKSVYSYIGLSSILPCGM